MILTTTQRKCVFATSLAGTHFQGTSGEVSVSYFERTTQVETVKKEWEKPEHMVLLEAKGEMGNLINT